MEELKNKLRKEFRLFVGTRCIIHPDFFPDECCGTSDWWLSRIETLLKEREHIIKAGYDSMLDQKIMMYKAELVEKIEKIKTICDDCGHYHIHIDELLNLIKE